MHPRGSLLHSRARGPMHGVLRVSHVSLRGSNTCASITRNRPQEYAHRVDSLYPLRVPVRSSLGRMRESFDRHCPGFSADRPGSYSPSLSYSLRCFTERDLNYRHRSVTFEWGLQAGPRLSTPKLLNKGQTTRYGPESSWAGISTA